MESECRRLGDFEIVREIGRGGMGVVYEAIQLSLNRKVALKVLPWGITTTDKGVARFQREAEAAGKLHHTNIVPIYAQGEEEGTYYYAMQFIEGRSLDRVVADTKGLDFSSASATELVRTVTAGTGATLHLEGAEPGERPEEEAPEAPPGRTTDLNRRYFRTVARMVAEVAEALEYAHGEGVIHRDIKPHNLMLTSESRLTITDFGIARFLDQPGVTVSGDMVGTPVYMSPEQLAAQRVPVDHRTDIYSLGATLYELLTLRVPFEGDTRDAVLQQVLVKEPKPLRRLNRRIPKDLETICLKAMEKDADRRYQRAGEFAQDLRAFAEGLPITARPIGPVGRLCRRALRRKALTAALAGALLALAAAAYFGLQVQYIRASQPEIRVSPPGVRRRARESATAAQIRSLKSALELLGREWGELRNPTRLDSSGSVVPLRVNVDFLHPAYVGSPEPVQLNARNPHWKEVRVTFRDPGWNWEGGSCEATAVLDVGKVDLPELLYLLVAVELVPQGANGRPVPVLSYDADRSASADSNDLVFYQLRSNPPAYLELKASQVGDLDADGYPEVLDPFGNPVLYSVGVRKPGAVEVWSMGVDGRVDERNDGLDNDGDGLVDEIQDAVNHVPELTDDIISW